MCLTNIQKPPNLRKPIIVDQSKNRPRKVCCRAIGRKKIDLKYFQFYTLLPGYVSLLPHVAGCWRLLHQLLGPRDHRGLESAVLRCPDTGATGPASGGHSLQSRGRETVWCRVHLTAYMHFRPRFKGSVTTPLCLLDSNCPTIILTWSSFCSVTKLSRFLPITSFPLSDRNIIYCRFEYGWKYKYYDLLVYSSSSFSWLVVIYLNAFRKSFHHKVKRLYKELG